MLLSPFRISTWFGCCLALVAQTQTAVTRPQTSGAISGVVVDANANKPIRRAIITLSTVETRPQDAVAWTDANGRFSFGYLPPGRYQLRASKDTYQISLYGAKTPGRPGAIIQLADGEARSDFIFRLQLMCAISGIVLDDDGEPLAGVFVSAMTPGFQRQKRTLLPGPGAITDVNGRYRISGLVPVGYVVVANTQQRQGLKMRPEVSASQPQQQFTYGLQYYPGSDRRESASLITLQPGQELSRIDFQLIARPMTSLAGRVVMPPGAAPGAQVAIAVMNEEAANRQQFGVGVSPQDFTFRLDQVPSGSYRLIAQTSLDGKVYRGVQRVDVGPAGVGDITIQLEPGIDLTGSVSVEGPDAAKHPAAFVSLVPGDGLPLNGQQPRANVNKNGTFKITGVPPGVWDINVTPIPPGGYLKSMLLGDEDVLTEDMVIRSSTSAPLKIVVSTQAAVLEGDVLQGDQPVRAVIVLAPEAKLRHVASFYRFALADDKGHFEMKSVTPGRYQIFAFEEFDQRSVQDPEVLKPFESAGVSVTLKEGQNPSLKLSLIAGARP
jgi:protocatechuate 3,4-dioxygenase beta subunit